jgi:competence protein ComEC
VAGVWLENDGDGATQEEAAARRAWAEDGPGMSTRTAGIRVWHGAGRRALTGASAACGRHDLVILSEPAEDAEPAFHVERPDASGEHPAVGAANAASSDNEGTACLVIDATFLAETGAVSLDLRGGEVRVRTARQMQGERLWSCGAWPQ